MPIGIVFNINKGNVRMKIFKKNKPIVPLSFLTFSILEK